MFIFLWCVSQIIKNNEDFFQWNSPSSRKIESRAHLRTERTPAKYLRQSVNMKHMGGPAEIKWNFLKAFLKHSRLISPGTLCKGKGNTRVFRIKKYALSSGGLQYMCSIYRKLVSETACTNVLCCLQVLSLMHIVRINAYADAWASCIGNRLILSRYQLKTGFRVGLYLISRPSFPCVVNLLPYFWSNS